MNFKKDFPIFHNNPGLVYLDNGASAQKPKMVIDGVSEFVSNYYSNIHRGAYDLSEKSEYFYFQAKKIISEFLNCKSSEIIFSYNSTYCINLVAQALCNSKILGKGDSVILGIWEHHANVVPRQILADIFHFDIRFIQLGKSCEIDWLDFSQKYDKTTKVVSIGHVSNVTGKIYDLKKIKSFLRDDTFFMVDGSQSFPNMPVNVQDIGCDCFAFTGHKAMSYTGIGGMYLKKDYIKTLIPIISGGGAIKDISTTSYELPTTFEKFEAGTPNIIGAVSLLKALEYIKTIGGMEVVQENEQKLISYILPKFIKLKEKVKLIGPKTNDRVAVFSFFIPEYKNFNSVGEIFASHNVAIRCGGHCAYPIHKSMSIPGTCRMSAYLYNDFQDIDKFFEVLNEIVEKL